MKRFLAALLLSVLALIPAKALAYDWSDIVQRVHGSTSMLTNIKGRGFCSAFVIDNERDYVMTAAHCVEPEYVEKGILFDRTMIDVAFYDETLDAAVLYVKGVDRPEIEPRTKLIKVGMPVLHHGYALEDGIFSHFRAGNISSIGTVAGLGGVWVLADQSGIGGMSGGPTVDTEGKLVFINQMSDRVKHFFGRDVAAVYKATAKYWKR